MRFNRATLALVALAASATTAEAKKLQTPVPAWRLKNLQFMNQPPNPAVKWRGYYVGPFTGTVLSDPTRPTINLFSVDVLNDIRWRQQWTGAFTRLTSNNFDATRHGIGAKEKYENAAYLASKFRAPKVGTQQWGGIQTAMCSPPSFIDEPRNRHPRTNSLPTLDETIFSPTAGPAMPSWIV